MKPNRRKPSLLEMMSKPPATGPPRRGLFGRSRHAFGPGGAKPLTEEEAQAALAEARCEASRSREPEKSTTPRHDSVPIVSVQNGRLTISLGTTGCVTAAGVLCAVILTAYYFGQPRPPSGSLTPAAALAQKSDAAARPLLPSLDESKRQTRRPPAGIPADPDLSHLLERPKTRSERAAAANQPARVGSASPAREPPLSPDRVYLQVESFRVTRDRSSEQLLKDLAVVREFLDCHGVPTFARRRSNGLVLFASQGFAAGKEQADEREAFRRRIEQLGRQFRASGGQYQFKGCLFVNYATTQAGDPV